MNIPVALSIPNPGWFCCQAQQTPPVTFDPAMFRALFPVFDCLTNTQLTAYFTMAGLFCPNVPQNPFNCTGVLPQLMMLVTAHIAWLLSPKNADGNPSAEGASSGGGLVGRISQATQGSVSVSLEFDATAGGASEQFFAQSQYGLMFWQATASIRTARYAASPTIVPGTTYPYAPWLLNGFWGAGFGLGWIA